MKSVDGILKDDVGVLSFLKERYPLYHLSNIFFRDIQYGIQALFERHGLRIGYSEAELHARAFVERLEKKKILVPIDRQSWVVHYETFKTPPPKPAAKPTAPSKPAPSAPAAPRPAGGLPPLKSAPAAGTPKPAGGLPPLKSSPAAGAAKQTGGLPPLKSSSPSGGAKSVPASQVQPMPEEQKGGPVRETQPGAPAMSQEIPAPPRSASTGQKGLPPIKSSVPAGKK